MKENENVEGKGKVALVTGAGSGIGRASAIALGKAGYVVALSGRRAGMLDETLAQADPGVQMFSVPADVSDPESIKALFAEVKKCCGRLDVLFNNAGIGAPVVPLENLAYEDWANVVNVNLTGVFLCTQQAFIMMKTQNPKGGRIINNGSISAHMPRPDSIAYTATKHAVTGLTRSTSLDGRKYNIACGQIDIGNAATDMTQRAERGLAQPDGSEKVEPRMDVEPVANAVVHMANLPLDANIQFMTIMATTMPYIGRG